MIPEGDGEIDIIGAIEARGVLDPDREPLSSGVTAAQTNNPKPRTQWVILAAVIAVLVVTFIVMSAAAFRGLGFSDDGFVMLITRYPREYLALPTLSHLFWNVVYEVVGRSIPALRIGGYVIALLVAWYLSVGIKSVLHSLGVVDTWPRPMLAALQVSVISTGFAPHMVFYQTPGYNNLAVITLNVTTGTVFCLISGAFVKWSARQQVASATLTGLAWWFLLLTKWPVAVVAGLLFTVVCLLCLDSWRLKWKLIVVSLISSMTAVAAFTHLFLAPVSDIIAGIQKGSDDLTGRYDSGVLVTQFLWHTAILVGELFAERWYWVVVALVIALICNRWESTSRQWLIVSFMLTYIFFEAVMGHLHGGLSPRTMNLARSIPHLTMLVVIILGVRMTRDHGIRASFNRVGLMVAVLSLSLVAFASAGTNNPFYVNATISTGAWVLVILVVLGMMQMTSLPYLLSTAAICSVVLFSAGTGTWFAPFHHDSLTNATVKITTGPAAGLYVTPTAAREIQALQDYVSKLDGEGLNSGRPARMVIIALNPGMAFVANARQPIYAWVTPLQDNRIFEMWRYSCEDVDTPFLFVIDETYEQAPIIEDFMTTGACATREFQPQQRRIDLQPPDVRGAATYKVYLVPGGNRQ